MFPLVPLWRGCVEVSLNWVHLHLELLQGCQVGRDFLVDVVYHLFAENGVTDRLCYHILDLGVGGLHVSHLDLDLLGEALDFGGRVLVELLELLLDFHDSQRDRLKCLVGPASVHERRPDDRS